MKKVIIKGCGYSLTTSGENSMKEDKIYQCWFEENLLFTSLSFDKAIGFLKGFLAAKYGKDSSKCQKFNDSI